jgi:hypothetical protein
MRHAHPAAPREASGGWTRPSAEPGCRSKTGRPAQSVPHQDGRWLRGKRCMTAGPTHDPICGGYMGVEHRGRTTRRAQWPRSMARWRDIGAIARLVKSRASNAQRQREKRGGNWLVSDTDSMLTKCATSIGEAGSAPSDASNAASWSSPPTWCMSDRCAALAGWTCRVTRYVPNRRAGRSCRLPRRRPSESRCSTARGALAYLRVDGTHFCQHPWRSASTRSRHL